MRTDVFVTEKEWKALMAFLDWDFNNKYPCQNCSDWLYRKCSAQRREECAELQEYQKKYDELHTPVVVLLENHPIIKNVITRYKEYLRDEAAYVEALTKRNLSRSNFDTAKGGITIVEDEEA
jgi:tRNA nucleotidyltransferase/poly(A) polymerase